METFLIVGAGVAGDTAASVLREVGFSGRIIIVGDEAERPYDRPPLSKGVLLSADAEAATYLHAADWYASQHIELRLDDACVRIDPAAHQASLASGEEIVFTKLLIATGATVRRLPAFDSGAVPAYYLRSMADARTLRAAMVAGVRVVVVGGGVIGMEVAASAIQRGCAVTVIEAQDRIMTRCVSPRVSAFLTAHHQGRGARIVCGTKLAAAQDVPGHVLLDCGDPVPTDLVVVGIGVTPNTALADAAGLRVDDGIVVDGATRTSHPDIHAAGDVTRFAAASGYLRAEHWRHAVDQATVAARVMMGGTHDYAESAWLWSDQYDLNIQVTGEGHGEAEVLRGSMAGDAFILFHLREGRVVGATSVNQARHKRAVAALVSARAQVDAAMLADPATDLKKLAGAYA